MATRKPAAADPTPAPAWCLHLLGAPRLVRARPADETALSATDAALLTLVALEGPINTERVAMWVWPGVDARRALTSLRHRLFRLRRRSAATLIVSGAQLQLAADPLISAEFVFEQAGPLLAYTNSGWPAPQFMQLGCRKAGTRHRLLTLHCSRRPRRGE